MNLRKSAVFLTIISLILNGAACGKADPPARDDSSIGETLDLLLANIHRDGTFGFEGLSWMVSRREITEQKNPDPGPPNQSRNEEDDRLIVEGHFPLDASVKQKVVYVFEDDRLVSGEYWFYTSDGKRFAELCNALRGRLAESLAAPLANDLNMLDPAHWDRPEKNTVSWEGTDRSQLWIQVLGAAQHGGEGEYMLLIKTASPLPERETLAS